jgi:putative FmdB family regulatory protein
MPTYEYKCKRCGHVFEKFSTKISEASSIDCLKCGEEAERLISGGAGLLFKGSGFYSTDYRSQSYKDAEKKESKATTSTGSSDKPDKPASGKTESKKSST